MANYTVNITTDISDQLKRYTLQMPLVQNNNKAHEFNVTLMNGTYEVPVENVSAEFLRADGTVVPIGGDYCTASGNVATVVLPEVCYAVQGRSTLTIDVSSGDVRTCIGFFSCMVFKTTSDSAVDPGTIIPSVSQLIEDINEALEKIPADYTELTEDVEELKTEMQNKQDTLTFDNVPTAGSQNPVTSDGIKNYVGGVPPFEKGTGTGSAQLKAYTDNGTAYTQIAKGVGSVAEGGSSMAAGSFAHAEGLRTYAHAEGAHAEGKGNIKHVKIRKITGLTKYLTYTDVDPNNPLNASDAGGYVVFVSEGLEYKNERIQSINTGTHIITLITSMTSTDGEKDAVVVKNAALYEAAHSEGYQTISKQLGSHSEGYKTLASNTGSHSEGMSCLALGGAAHAEGSNTQASGMYSHSEGADTVAGSDWSHAEGIGTFTNSNGQHVQGRYNDPNDGTEYAHIVGGGTQQDPKNIHTIDWNGNTWYAGTLSIGTGENIVTLSASELAALKALLQ